MPVVDHADELDAAGFVHLEIHLDQVSLGVESIPDELGDRADRILLAGEPQQMVGFGLDGCSHALTVPGRAAEQPGFPGWCCTRPNPLGVRGPEQAPDPRTWAETQNR